MLRCAEGLQSKVVATELGVHEHTVGQWRRRFLADRIDGLLDEARPDRPHTKLPTVLGDVYIQDSQMRESLIQAAV